MTRSLDEFEAVRNRGDRTTSWGLGCHPGVARAQAAFDRERFAALLRDAAFVGEVGIDGKSRVSMDVQRSTFADILEALLHDPRVASVHSSSAQVAVLDVIEKVRAPGVILHWWRGSGEQTARAIDLGCFFSVNSRATATTLNRLPRDRVLTETDHPFGDKREKPPRRPAKVDYVLRALGRTWQTSVDAAARQVWANFRTLTMSTATADMLPEAFKRSLLSA